MNVLSHHFLITSLQPEGKPDLFNSAKRNLKRLRLPPFYASLTKGYGILPDGYLKCYLLDFFFFGGGGISNFLTLVDMGI